MKRISGLLAILMLVAASSNSSAARFRYKAYMDGAGEAPPNDSPGIGFAQVIYDDVAHTLIIDVNFSGLVGTDGAGHIHAPTAIDYGGIARVATTQPTFAGFPTGVTSGTFHSVLDLTQESSYDPTFNDGTPPNQELALAASLALHRAYFNLHTSVFSNGEIEGFFVNMPGDYNNDGFVDAADYTVWRDSLGQVGDDLPADGDNSKTVDQADYTSWAQNFGRSRFEFTPSGGNASGVPEPSAIDLVCTATITLIVGALVSLSTRVGRRRRSETGQTLAERIGVEVAERSSHRAGRRSRVRAR